MNWSHYQKKIFEYYEDNEENLLIEACAGSGKTKVIEELNARIPYDYSVINAAFDTHSNETMKEKFSARGILNEVKSFNSIGWQVYRKNIHGVQFQKEKNFFWLQRQMTKDADQTKQFWKIQGTVCRIISLFKQLNLQTFPENWVELCDTYGTETGEFKVEDELEHWARRLWDYSSNNLKIADYDDQIYQVNKEKWYVYKRQVAFIDEAQDLSPMQIALALQLGERIICCGDRHQAIYVFRGADINAIPNIIDAIKAKCLPLSICYRCSKAVIQRAQIIVPQIEAASNAIEGTEDTINIENFWKQILESNNLENQYVLCRTTAPLVTKCLEVIRQGRKAFVRGRDIGKSLFSTIDKIAEMTNSNRIEGFIAALLDYRIEQIDRLTRTNRASEAITVGDRLDTLEALSIECTYIEDLYDVIEKIFSNDQKEGIEFSTIHKAKGREKPNVYLIRPDLLPHPKSPAHLMQIESNLHYVAITRAQDSLFTVVEPRKR